MTTPTATTSPQSRVPMPALTPSPLPAAPSIAAQTAALFVDAYRELNSKLLFWVTLVLSGVAVAAFAAIGLDERGLRIFWHTFPLPMLNTQVMPAPQFYKYMFANFAIGLWLTWAAMILALVSTAGIFPDLMSGGAIELFASKPISRLRLFFTRYLTGLLFVTLQVVVFCAASFIVIGIRGGTWEWGVFLAVPLVVMVFSYLFGLCVLVGVLTRSTIAALLITWVLWMTTAGVASGETAMLEMSMADQIRQEQIDRLQSQVAQDQQDLAAARAFEAASTRPARPGSTSTKPSGHPPGISASAIAMRLQVAQLSLDAETSAEKSSVNWQHWHALFYAVYFVLPKTAETDLLIDRWLSVAARLPRERIAGAASDQVWARQRSGPFATRNDRWLAFDRAREQIAARPASWVIGTSLTFEAVTVLLAAWVFCRRDY